MHPWRDAWPWTLGRLSGKSPMPVPTIKEIIAEMPTPKKSRIKEAQVSFHNTIFLERLSGSQNRRWAVSQMVLGAGSSLS